MLMIVFEMFEKVSFGLFFGVFMQKKLFVAIGDFVAIGKNEIDVMADCDDSHSFAMQCIQQLVNLNGTFGIEARCGLIEQQELALAHERARDKHALALPAA